MTHDARHDALIIGGGPAGATVALLLAKGGWSVAVTEKAAFPRRKVCGEFISATTLRPFTKSASAKLSPTSLDPRCDGWGCSRTTQHLPLPYHS